MSLNHISLEDLFVLEDIRFASERGESCELALLDVQSVQTLLNAGLVSFSGQRHVDVTITGRGIDFLKRVRTSPGPSGRSSHDMAA